jgi:hypothetical protein
MFSQLRSQHEPQSGSGLMMTTGFPLLENLGESGYIPSKERFGDLGHYPRDSLVIGVQPTM